MSSFLEKINNQSKDGTVKPPASSASSKNEQPKTPEPSVNNSVPASSVSKIYSSGVGVTEHEVEIDRSYGRRNFIRFISAILVVALLVVGIFFAVRYYSMVELPNFEGKTITEIRKWCLDNDIYLSENTIYSMDIAANYVVSQSLPAGTKLSPKDMLEMTYSLGPDPKERITVPDLMSMTPAEIQEWIDNNRLSNTKLTEEYSEVEKGKVIRYAFSSPSVSEVNFTRGDTLTIYVSRGSGTYYGPTMRDFYNKTKSEAENWCYNYGMTAIFTEQASDLIEEGRIISQSVGANTTVNYGSTIEFVVSIGPGITIPDFSNIYKEEAQDAVSGLTVVVKEVYSTTVPYGGFISQSIEAGTKVYKKGLTVTVEYSKGKPKVPNFIGLMEYNLEETFYNLKREGVYVTYTITYVDSKQPKGQIVGASKNNEPVEQYSVIEFEVSRGNLTDNGTPTDPMPKLYRVPNYSGVLKENARDVDPSIPVTIVIQYSDTVPYGQLISQSITAGSYITSDDRVTLYYSAGKPYIGRLEGKTEYELPAMFYEYKQMGANITYEVVYVDSDQPKGTVVGASKQNEFISTTEVIQIQISKGLK